MLILTPGMSLSCQPKQNLMCTHAPSCNTFQQQIYNDDLQAFQLIVLARYLLGVPNPSPVSQHATLYCTQEVCTDSSTSKAIAVFVLA